MCGTLTWKPLGGRDSQKYFCLSLLSVGTAGRGYHAPCFVNTALVLLRETREILRGHKDTAEAQRGHPVDGGSLWHRDSFFQIRLWSWDWCFSEWEILLIIFSCGINSQEHSESKVDTCAVSCACWVRKCVLNWVFFSFSLLCCCFNGKFTAVFHGRTCLGASR